MRSGGPWQKSLGLCLALVTSAAGAQTLAPEGQPIVTNHYAIDLTQGPVFASSRVVALAGTFVAMADGIDGDTQNPASPGVRVPYSYSYSDVDFELERVLRAEDEAEAALDRAELWRAERRVHQELVARYEAMSRFHALVMSSFLLTGTVPQGVGIEGWGVAVGVWH